MDPYLLRVMLCGFLIAAIAGPIGCLVMWRRMAFFGDAIAHSSLLGIALGFALGIDIQSSVLVFSLIVTLSLGLKNRALLLTTDTRLALLSHGALAGGMLAVSFFPQMRGDINSLLFGDILALSQDDLFQIMALTLISVIILKLFWKRFISFILSEEIAFVEGYNTLKTRMLFFALIGFFVSLTAKAIGVLLMTALLVIPAAAARPLAKSPSQMAAIASTISALSILGGFTVSFQCDLPVAPSIVVSALLFFGLITGLSKRQ